MMSASQTSRRQRMLRGWRGRDPATEGTVKASREEHLGNILHIYDIALRDETGKPGVKASEGASKRAQRGPLD